MKTFLIIGVKGFTRIEVVDYLVQKGKVVYGADVVVDYGVSNYYQIDATNSDYSYIFSRKQFDICINCSGAASVPDSLNNPMRDYLLNSVNVFKILDSVRKYNPNCRVINLSSAAVYGNPESLPVKRIVP